MERRSRVPKPDAAHARRVADALNRRIELHTCRQHHTMLRHILNEFPSKAPAPGAAMMMLLSRLRAILLRHLKLEDDYVYPALVQSPDEHLRTSARTFRLEMGGVLRAFEDFEKRWPHAEAIDADLEQFWNEWQPLRRALEARMHAEDSGLYKDAEAYFTEILSEG